MRAAFLAILLLAMPLAGCFGALPGGRDPASEGATPADARERFVWNMTSCREIIATFDVDSAALQAVLPAGFTAQPGRTPGRTTVGIDIFECGSAVVTEGTMPGASYASFWSSVDAPAELMGNATSAFVKWDTLVVDPIALAALTDAGAHVRGGVASVRDASPAGGIVGEIEYEGLGRVRVSTLPGTPPSSGGPGEGAVLREWSPAGPDGTELAMWEVTIVQWDDARAPGIIEAPADSMAARLYGATRIPSLVGLGMADLRDGYMETHAPRPGPG